ncbi:MAG: hypothetical protein JSS81_03270 [Acidobacteria bacterium]|nr:hypothetical protein [Acidobacteriota bacterium]
MQANPNVPNPDVNSTVDESGNRYDIERENDRGETVEDIPLPPTEPKPAPVEEPPDTEKTGIDEPSPPGSPKLV